jgi:hypothetical protein
MRHQRCSLWDKSNCTLVISGEGDRRPLEAARVSSQTLFVCTVWFGQRGENGRVCYRKGVPHIGRKMPSKGGEGVHGSLAGKMGTTRPQGELVDNNAAPEQIKAGWASREGRFGMGGWCNAGRSHGGLTPWGVLYITCDQSLLPLYYMS